MAESRLHPAIQEELDMLHAQFPTKLELTLEDYASYFQIDRHYASQHFNRVNSGKVKINHKRIGKLIIIPILDFAYWLAQHKVYNGGPLILPSLAETKDATLRKRGFTATQNFEYRKLG